MIVFVPDWNAKVAWRIRRLHSETWLVHMCDLTHSLMRHDAFMRKTRLIHMWDTTHSYVRHDAFICATWPIDLPPCGLPSRMENGRPCSAADLTGQVVSELNILLLNNMSTRSKKPRTFRLKNTLESFWQESKVSAGQLHEIRTTCVDHCITKFHRFERKKQSAVFTSARDYGPWQLVEFDWVRNSLAVRRNRKWILTYHMQVCIWQCFFFGQTPIRNLAPFPLPLPIL